jgi:hypothetical protein
MPEVKLGLEAVLTIDGVEITNVKDLTVSLEKAEADASTRANNGWRATVGTLKDASIEFTVLNKDGDSAFGLLQGLWSSGDPCDVGISDAGGTLTLTCEVMNFNVNQNLEEVISADVTLTLLTRFELRGLDLHLVLAIGDLVITRRVCRLELVIKRGEVYVRIDGFE